MSEHEVVPDALRDGHPGKGQNVLGPAGADLVGGKTIFVPGLTARQARQHWAEMLRRHGLLLRSYSTVLDGRAGVIVWAIER